MSDKITVNQWILLTLAGLSLVRVCQLYSNDGSVTNQSSFVPVANRGVHSRYRLPKVLLTYLLIEMKLLSNSYVRGKTLQKNAVVCGVVDVLGLDFCTVVFFKHHCLSACQAEILACLSKAFRC